MVIEGKGTEAGKCVAMYSSNEMTRGQQKISVCVVVRVGLNAEEDLEAEEDTAEE